MMILHPLLGAEMPLLFIIFLFALLDDPDVPKNYPKIWNN